MDVDQTLEELRSALDASRVTLRQEASDRVFPLTHETMAPGVSSLRDVEAPNMAQQPVLVRVARGEQVVQDDCENTDTDNDDYHTMRGLYGGLGAQIVTPIVVDGATVAAISVHHLGSARAWTDQDARLCRDTAQRLRIELGLDKAK